MNGPAVLYYANGRKEAEGRYVHGLREGVWVDWNPAGERIREATFKDGKWNGLTVVYIHGRKREETTFRDEELFGPYRRWDEQGHLIEAGTYDPANKLHGTITRWNGEIEEREEWDHGKFLRTTYYVDGVPQPLFENSPTENDEKEDAPP